MKADVGWLLTSQRGIPWVRVTPVGLYSQPWRPAWASRNLRPTANALETHIDPTRSRLPTRGGDSAVSDLGAGRPWIDEPMPDESRYGGSGPGQFRPGRFQPLRSRSRAPFGQNRRHPARRQPRLARKRKFQLANCPFGATFRPGWGFRGYGNPGPGQPGSGSRPGCAAGPAARNGWRPEPCQS